MVFSDKGFFHETVTFFFGNAIVPLMLEEAHNLLNKSPVSFPLGCNRQAIFRTYLRVYPERQDRAVAVL
jgi:hypothetical protein